MKPWKLHKAAIRKDLIYWDKFPVKFISIAVPKTATTSFSELQVASSPGSRSGRHKGQIGGRTHYDLHEHREVLLTATDPQIVKLGGEEWFAEAYKFGFVRNPWDRAVSLYENRKDRHQCKTFEEFVDKYDGASFTQSNPSYHANQIDWFKSRETNVVMADYIGRYENLEADIIHILGKLNLAVPKIIPHIGRPEAKVRSARLPPRETKDKPYQEYYTKHTREVMLEKCAEDIEYFQYTFE